MNYNGIAPIGFDGRSWYCAIHSKNHPLDSIGGRCNVLHFKPILRRRISLH